MIGLEDTRDGQALLGVIHLPMLGVTYAGGRGLGAARNGRPIRLPESVPLEDAILSVGDYAAFQAAGREEDYRRLLAMHGYVRGYTDCFGHGLVIEGAIGAMLDPALNPWDYVPTQALVEAAGGVARVRLSKVAGKFDLLFGHKELVAQIAASVLF
jgi:fructose-1,6-bisphosphatase/inositol monophosphatase family enzyme